LIDRSGDRFHFALVGTRNQRLAAAGIARPFSIHQVVNLCGQLAWREVIARLRACEALIGNNSGLSHLAARDGVPTMCVFGGSHNRMEWRPQGPHVRVISRAIGCSPCQLDHKASSPYDKACLRQISPELVADAFLSFRDEAAERA
jgi:ADP-heptose:LPS heptosyltransferase